MRALTVLTSLLLLFLLAACAPAAVPAPTPAATQPPAGPYDGQWAGQAVLPDGRPLELNFTIRGSTLSAVTYAFTGGAGLRCTNLFYEQIPAAGRPPLKDERLSADLGIDLRLSASFQGPDTASGTLAVDWQGRSACPVKFDLPWQARRVAGLPAETPVSAPAPAPLCGRLGCAALLAQLLVFGLANGAVLALNAISVTVVYGAVRTLNLAHGDVFSLSTVVVTSLLIGLNARPDWPPLQLFGALVLALLAAMAFGMILNILLERLAFRPFRGRSRLAPLIATLGISFMLFQGAMFWRTHQASWIPGEHRSVPGLPEVPTDGIPNLLPSLDLFKAVQLPFNVVFGFNDLFILVVALLCAWGAHIFLRRTRAGRAIRACMQNPDLAQMIGVDLNATIRLAFAFGGLLAGVAAFIFAIYYGRPFGQNGAQSGLFAFTAAMLGGVGSPFGALLSSLILGIFGSFSDYFISAEWTPALLLLLLIGLLYLRPSGFFAGDDDSAQAATLLRDSLSPSPSGPRRDRRLAWMLLALALFPLVSLLLGLGWQILVRGVGIFILLALGLNILLGLAGVLDLGYAAAFGVGAYTAAILTNPWGAARVLLPANPDFLLIMLAGALASGFFGLCKGVLTSRLRSETLALATLALGLLVPRLVINLKFLTGGAAGISALPAPRILGISFANPTAGYYLVFALVALAAWASQRLAQSRTGRAWLAISEDESAAGASGVDAGRYRLLALVLSSALAGMAGALYAGSFAYVDPDILSFHWTAMLLAMVILGGAGSVPGVMLGAMLVIGYDKLFIPRFSALLSLFWPSGWFIGSVPDLRGTSFFNFGLILYLTVLLRARRKH